MIRLVEEKEILDCVSVIRESFRTVAEKFGFTEENAPRFTAFATDENRLNWQYHIEHRPMIGYFDGNKIVGYYSLEIKDDEIEINNLCVLPEYRHQKIGEKLLEDVFLRAKEYGKNKMHIGIVEENQVLRKWYEAHGFAHIGTEKFDFFPFTCGYMIKEL